MYEGIDAPDNPVVGPGRGGAFRRILGGLGKGAGGLMTNKYGGGVKQGYEAGTEFGQDTMESPAERLARQTKELLNNPEILAAMRGMRPGPPQAPPQL